MHLYLSTTGILPLLSIAGPYILLGTMVHDIIRFL